MANPPLDPQVAAFIRRLDDRMKAVEARGAGTGSPTHPDVRASVGLPAVPGSIWSFLAKMAWADRDFVFAHIIELRADLDGAVDGAGIPTAGAAVVVPDIKIIAGYYFFCHQLSASIAGDPSNPLEETIGDYCNFQLDDDSRQAPLGQDVINMGELCGSKYRTPVPMRFTEYPLAWWPDCQLRCTFYPLPGFPAAVEHSITQATTRAAVVQLHGMLVRKPIVDNLLGENRKLIAQGNLLTAAGAR